MTSAFDYLPVVFAVFWKSGVALGAALGINLLVRKRSADLRRLVLSAAVVVMFVAAAALPVLPHWTAVTPVWFGLQRPATQAVPVQAPAQAIINDDELTAPGNQLNTPQPVARSVDLTPWLIPLTWFAGAAALLARFAINLAHIQAYDFLMRGLVEIARALIWFQPLMWIVWQQLREEQELACDNRVLAAGRKPSAYAKLLLDWDATPGVDSWIAVGIANRSCLKRRVYALLDPNLRRDRVARAGVASVWFLGLAMALPLAAISFTQATPASPAQAQTREAQPEPPPKPKFDVASIKPCQPDDGPGRGGTGDMGTNGGVNPNAPEGVGGYFRASPGRLDITCGSILTMARFAYVDHGSPLLNNPGGHMHEAEAVQGVPKWALAARYTIHAETDDPVANGPTEIPGKPGYTPAEQLLYGPMLRSLLEDRFQLKVHRQQEQVPMYALTVAKGGLKLKPMEAGDCVPPVPGQGMRWLAADEKPYCGWVGGRLIHGPNRAFLGGGITMQELARILGAMVLDRNVTDRTAITGSFIVRFEYAPDENTRCVGIAQMCTVDPNSDIPPGPTIFTAIEQLGLKLEPIKGPQEHIVIDHVDPPSEN
jgi:bla regulator protein BlaR1